VKIRQDDFIVEADSYLTKKEIVMNIEDLQALRKAAIEKKEEERKKDIADWKKDADEKAVEWLRAIKEKLDEYLCNAATAGRDAVYIGITAVTRDGRFTFWEEAKIRMAKAWIGELQKQGFDARLRIWHGDLSIYTDGAFYYAEYSVMINLI